MGTELELQVDFKSHNCWVFFFTFSQLKRFFSSSHFSFFAVCGYRRPSSDHLLAEGGHSGIVLIIIIIMFLFGSFSLFDLFGFGDLEFLGLVDHDNFKTISDNECL